MYIFEVQYERSSGRGGVVNVLAKDAAEAIENSKRHLKKNYYEDAEIVALNKKLTVNVLYLTKARKR